MIIPQIGNIYEFENKQIGVYAQTPLFKVYGLNYHNDETGSSMITVNWWKFAKYARLIGKIKQKNSAY